MGLFRKRAIKKLRVFNEYVSYIIDEVPGKTAVTLIRDDVPRTNSQLYQSDICWAIEHLVNALKDASQYSYEGDMKEILGKVENQIEPTVDEWNFVAHILEGMDFG